MNAVTNSAARDAIVEIDDLKVWFANRDGIMRAVDGVSFDLLRGETLGIVGESGCGKSVTALTIMRLIPSPPSGIAGGAIRFNGEDLLKFDEERMRTIRGNEISMIFQEPMTSLNPVLTVGEQIARRLCSIRSSRKAPRASWRSRCSTRSNSGRAAARTNILTSCPAGCASAS